MLFSSLIFLYAFLPVVLILNFLVRKELRNPLLLISSLIFFAWGGVSYSLILIASLILNYVSGLLIDKNRASQWGKIFLTLGIVLNLGLLGLFKYADFIIENINSISSLFNFPPAKKLGIVLPLGISFYTFQAMSYIIDVYRKDATVQRNFFKLALYISFFPQLIAGPIVKYNLIEKQLTNRRIHLTGFVYGTQRFILGLAKKILIANQMAFIADKVFAIPTETMTSLTAWTGMIAYTLQIYFDFSGYSDMAIGLGRMFGFQFPENFNFPYISRSIKEFWQRWHMTLSGWFKSYLYIPLGGNRISSTRTIINLLIVFFATSIWHGASWNFVIWGMTHGFFLMLERIGLGKILNKAYAPIQYIYTLFIVASTWIFFRADTLSYGWSYFLNLFGTDILHFNKSVAPYIEDKVFIYTLILAIISSSRFWVICSQKIKMIYLKLPLLFRRITLTGYQFILITLIASALIACTASLVSGSYNPFIYFRF